MKVLQRPYMKVLVPKWHTIKRWEMVPSEWLDTGSLLDLEGDDRTLDPPHPLLPSYWVSILPCVPAITCGLTTGTKWGVTGLWTEISKLWGKISLSSCQMNFLKHLLEQLEADLLTLSHSTQQRELWKHKEINSLEVGGDSKTRREVLTAIRNKQDIKETLLTGEAMWWW